MEKLQPIQPSSQALPLSFLLSLAVAVHLPLLAMELPLKSDLANFHIFFASLYLHHWFDPWNVKWYAGFSQTTFAPLSQQWVAIIARGIGLDLAYMAVQLIAILLLVLGVYRFARLWVGPRAASLAAVAGIFLGSETFLVYSAGQLATTLAASIFLNALPFLYEWVKRASWGSFLKAAALFAVAAAAHEGSIVFGSIFFGLPVLALAYFEKEDGRVSAAGFWSRTFSVAILSGAAIAIVLLPLWIALTHYPLSQIPVPHPSRANYLLSPHWGLAYFVVPYGALILALPFIFLRGSAVARLRPLMFGFWIAFLIGLGSTTPVGPDLLGHAFDLLTMERFSYWATLLALPFAGLLAEELIARFTARATVALGLLAFLSCGLAVAWSVYHAEQSEDFDVTTVAEWLNRGGHDQYRYFTLGFGNKISRLAMLTDASSVDGDWALGRMLPEVAGNGVGPLTDSKNYGEHGLDVLRTTLKDADQYGVKWVFVRDHSYDPLLYFTGWQAVDSLEANTIVVWTKDGVPPATPVESSQKPPSWVGLMWGIFPIGCSIVAILLLLIPEKKRRVASLAQPVLTGEENSIFGRLVS
jgi:hypothetical protein